MSHKTYDELWQSAQNLLSSTIQSEPTQADSREQRNLLSTLYLRYIIIANRLNECVDQMVQPQKRELIRKILEAVLGRIVELKYDLVEADLNEFTHCGDALEMLALTPSDVELKIPHCFLEDRAEELEYRKSFIDLKYPRQVLEPKKIQMTEQQAIILIQTHERARQGRLRAQFMKEVKSTKERSKPTEGEPTGQGNLSAALKIQKVWRGCIARRNTRRRKLQEMILIGMVPTHKKSDHIKLSEDNALRRKKLQKQRLEEYNKAVAECKVDLETNQKAVVFEQLGDQVRNWLYEYREQTGKIPEFAGSERSTSRLLLSRQGTDSELSKSSSKESKKSKSSSKDKETKSDKDEEEEGVKAMVSLHVPELTMRKEEYDETWRNKDETENPHQEPYKNLIEHSEMNSMESELRKVVDEIMRNELTLLQEALDRDKGHKGKKPKKASKKVRRSGKKSKKKKEKDLTPDRTTESLLEELITNGIIKPVENYYLKDFIGDKSYNFPVPHNKGSDPKISIGDLRQILVEYYALPMLTSHLHESGPHLKSLLIAGAIGSGKDMLVHAICNEIGATLFDLTPANIAGKYPGKSGLIMLLHLIIKVARLLQPSIIYMDNAERPFVKKIPKTDKTDPKRLKKDLPKLVKNLCPDERIMLIGVTNCAWEADQKLLEQVYQKYLYIPKPDYGSRFTLWTHLLGQYSAISWQFDYSGITKITDGYSVGAIVSTVKEIMTVKRKLQLRVRQLSLLELINVLAKRMPIYKEEEEALYTWWNKTPMVKRRTKAIEIQKELELEIQTKQAKSK